MALKISDHGLFEASNTTSKTLTCWTGYNSEETTSFTFYLFLFLTFQKKFSFRLTLCLTTKTKKKSTRWLLGPTRWLVRPTRWLPEGLEALTLSHTQSREICTPGYLNLAGQVKHRSSSVRQKRCIWGALLWSYRPENPGECVYLCILNNSALGSTDLQD